MRMFAKHANKRQRCNSAPMSNRLFTCLFISLALIIELVATTMPQAEAAASGEQARQWAGKDLILPMENVNAIQCDKLEGVNLDNKQTCLIEAQVPARDNLNGLASAVVRLLTMANDNNRAKTKSTGEQMVSPAAWPRRESRSQGSKVASLLSAFDNEIGDNLPPGRSRQSNIPRGYVYTQPGDPQVNGNGAARARGDPAPPASQEQMGRLYHGEMSDGQRGMSDETSSGGRWQPMRGKRW